MTRIGGSGVPNGTWAEGGEVRLAQVGVDSRSKPVRSTPASGTSPRQEITTTEDLRAALKAGKVKVVGGTIGGPGGRAARALAIATAFFRSAGSTPGAAPTVENLAGRIVSYMEGRPGSYLNAFKGLSKGQDYRAMAGALDEASKGLTTPSGCSPMSVLHAQMSAYRTGNITMSELLQNAAKGKPGDLPWVANQLRGAYQIKMPQLPTNVPTNAGLTPDANLGGLITGPGRAATPKPGTDVLKYPNWMNKPTGNPPEPR